MKVLTSTGHQGFPHLHQSSDLLVVMKSRGIGSPSGNYVSHSYRVEEVKT